MSTPNASNDRRAGADVLVFFDTEFYEDGRTIDLISIGMVAEDGRELYACNLDAQLHRCHEAGPWMRDNVLRQLPPYDDAAWMRRAAIKNAVVEFLTFGARGGEPLPTRDGKKPELWAYYADYDWVVLCQLFGRMIDLPKWMPMWCRDLKQLSADVGDPQHPKQDKGEHNALADARWNHALYKYLMELRRGGQGGV